MLSVVNVVGRMNGSRPVLLLEICLPQTMNLLKNALMVMFFSVIGLLACVGGKSVLDQLWRRPAVELTRNDTLLAQLGTPVVLFATTTCPYCKQAREFLDAAGVSYREMLIDESAEADAVFTRLDEPGVPVLLTRDRIIRGFAIGSYQQVIASSVTHLPGTVQKYR